MWQLSNTWQERLLSYQRLVVGFSGGLDSTVLLHLLASEPALSNKLHAVHVHHGLSPNADAWLAHCRAFCAKLGVSYTAESISLNTTSNLEEVARDARYAIFEKMLGSKDCLLLAHHLDDQAETVLLNLLRGTGIDGLAAMPELRRFAKGYLARPLLSVERVSLQAYASTHQLSFIEDESNQDTRFSRNYLRHEIMPRLKKRFPRAHQAMSHCAAHARAAADSLQALAYVDCPELALKQDKLSLKCLYDLPRTRVVQVLRVWLKQQGIKALEAKQLNLLFDEVIFARRDGAPCFRIGGVCIRCYRDDLYLIHDNSVSSMPRVTREILLSKGVNLPEGQAFSVRQRCGGEYMVWRGHTRSLKKIFQMLSVPPWLRDTIPLVFIDDTLVALLGFAVADAYSMKEESYEAV